MFFKKKKKDKINEKIHTTTATTVKEESKINMYSKEIVKFINNIKSLIRNTTEQQNMLNDQHDTLTELTEDVQYRMASISDLTIKTDMSTESLSDEGNKLLDITTNVVEISQKGKDSMENLANIIKVLGEENKKNQEMITALANKFNQVTDIVELINSIASQTNMLALNASIEAARAGEQGRGFAVVAEEIKKLATQTEESTGNITNLINSISIETENVQNNSERSIEVIQRGLNTSIEAMNNIDFSLTSVAQIDEEVKNVINILNDQKSNVSNMINEITNVDVILKHTIDVINSHIDDANILDEHLEKTSQNIQVFEEISSTLHE
mgnify:FL=1